MSFWLLNTWTENLVSTGMNFHAKMIEDKTPDGIRHLFNSLNDYDDA